MFEDEQIIGGVLCYRNSPDGPWTPFTCEALSLTLKIERGQRISAEGQRDIMKSKLDAIRELTE